LVFGERPIRHHHSVEIDGKIRDVSFEANSPTLCDTVKQYSGYFDATEKKQYFYWFFESRNKPSTDPFIMWLTGGPGCSSILALLAENGPCKVNEWATDTMSNPYSWNTKSNIMWVDQPPGTGFSIASGEYDTSEEEIAQDMWAFLQNFITAYPHYFQNGFYVIGESYGGHYVPVISNYVYTQNSLGKGTMIPLKGFAIGNGLTDPYIQFAYYAQMAYNSSTAPSVISKQDYDLMVDHIPTCQKEIETCNQDNTDQTCDAAYTYCTTWELEPVTITGVNPYDLRIPCGTSNLCYNFTNIDTWLNNATVQKQLGVSKKWEECQTIVDTDLEQDWMLDYQLKIPVMLENGIRGLIYAGDQDFICNWLGNQAWTYALPWDHQTDFQQAMFKPYYNYGNIKTAYNFTFLQVFQAGHMVPMDQPKAALQLVDDFLSGAI